jgi:integrase
MRDTWAAVLSEAGIEDLRIHDLRHAFATRGASLGASALILRDALGHKTLAMTSRYVARQIDPVRTLADRVAAEMLGVVQDNGAAAAEAIEFDPAERKRGQGNVR